MLTEEQAKDFEPTAHLRLEPRKTFLLLVVILAVAAALRVWGISFGLPYDMTFDEGKEVHRAFKLGVGEFNSGLGKGGLYFILFLEYGVLYVVQWLTGQVANPQDFAVQILKDPTVAFMLGRLTVVLMAVFTLAVIFLIAWRVHNSFAALAAALIGATAFRHAEHSHSINVDIGMVLAMWTAVWFFMEYERTRRWPWLIVSGFSAAIAIEFKVPGAIVVLTLLFAVFCLRRKVNSIRVSMAEATVVLASTGLFLTLICPGWVHSARRYYRAAVGSEVAKVDQSAPEHLEDTIASLTVFGNPGGGGYLQILSESQNLPLLLFAVAGGLIGLAQRNRWTGAWIFTIIVFLVIFSVSKRNPSERYLLPIMPALWLMAGDALSQIWRLRRWAALSAGLLIIVPSLVPLIRQNVEWSKPDTRLLAKQWIESQVPSGSKILMDGTRYRFVMSPPLNPSRSVVAEQTAKASLEGHTLSRGVSGMALELYAAAMEQLPEPRYDIHSTVWGLKLENPDFHIDSGYQFIVTSSEVRNIYSNPEVSQRFPRSAQFYDALDTDSRFEAVYASMPVPWQRGGPEIRVYRLHSGMDAHLETRKSRGSEL